MRVFIDWECVFAMLLKVDSLYYELCLRSLCGSVCREGLLHVDWPPMKRQTNVSCILYAE